MTDAVSVAVTLRNKVVTCVVAVVEFVQMVDVARRVVSFCVTNEVLVRVMVVVVLVLMVVFTNLVVVLVAVVVESALIT
jgi:hypothetical protein